MTDLLKRMDAMMEAMQRQDENGRRRRRDIECFFCRKKGHVQADCWAKNGRPDSGKTQYAIAKVTVAETEKAPEAAPRPSKPAAGSGN